ncbi:MAG TPA: succinate dehydrogenase iron-sulfur subunit [bacterium]|nr:succinate dehydrogenase iron-sulfur subunit [bacterium]HPN44489.1 succinate dehydrogenase iron-sulfur subunit [bacterium]
MNEDNQAGKTVPVIFQVLRYNPETDTTPRMQEFEVPVSKGMTVLDGLHWIKENLDGSLSWRSSCRMGVCGSCGMFINGYPRLACSNQILHLSEKRIVIKPLPNYEIIRDLVPDLEKFFRKHKSVKPYLIRRDIAEQNMPTGEYFQSPDELTRYIQFAYCIKCGLCLSACPTMATDEKFTGPQALAQAWRYNSDSRDEGCSERQKFVYDEQGVSKCHFAGTCSDVCPKGVDPSFAIQLLKKDIFLKTMRIKKDHAGATVLKTAREYIPQENIPNPPKPTV